ncbi:uncharacterized protein GJ701_012529 isoform 3-T5 [Geothlypis trichas]
MMRSGPPPPAASSSSSWCGRCDPPRPGSAVAVTVPAGTRPAGPLSPRAAPARHAPRAASGARTGGSSAASAPPLPARARARASLPLARLSLPLVPSAIPPPPAAPRSRSPARRRRPARCPPARPRPEPPPPHPPVLPTNHTAAAPGRARVTSPRGRVTQAAPGRGPGRSRARAPPPLRGKREGPAGPAAREMRSLGSAATHVGTWRGKRLPPRAAQGRLDRQERRSVPGSRRSQAVSSQSTWHGIASGYFLTFFSGISCASVSAPCLLTYYCLAPPSRACVCPPLCPRGHKLSALNLPKGTA